MPRASPRGDSAGRPRSPPGRPVAPHHPREGPRSSGNPCTIRAQGACPRLGHRTGQIGGGRALFFSEHSSQPAQNEGRSEQACPTLAASPQRQRRAGPTIVVRSQPPATSPVQTGPPEADPPGTRKSDLPVAESPQNPEGAHRGSRGSHHVYPVPAYRAWRSYTIETSVGYRCDRPFASASSDMGVEVTPTHGSIRPRAVATCGGRSGRRMLPSSASTSRPIPPTLRTFPSIFPKTSSRS